MILLNYYKNKIVNKYYNNPEQISNKIYNMTTQKILFSSYVITFKNMVDLILISPNLIFLIFKVNHTLFWVISECFIFSYILIFGALIFKLDKLNEIGKIPKFVKMWFFWKNIHFCFYDKFYQHWLYDNTYKYLNDINK